MKEANMPVRQSRSFFDNTIMGMQEGICLMLMINARLVFGPLYIMEVARERARRAWVRELIKARIARLG